MSDSKTRLNNAAVLHMLCGKIASGKSTLTKHLARTENAVVISEDVWLTHLYPGEIRTLDDYVRCSVRIRRVLSEHVQALLSAGVSIVLDFPFNTRNRKSRPATMRVAWDSTLCVRTRAGCHRSRRHWQRSSHGRSKRGRLVSPRRCHRL